MFRFTAVPCSMQGQSPSAFSKDTGLEESSEEEGIGPLDLEAVTALP